MLKAYKIKDIIFVVAPQFDELRSKVMYKSIKGYYPEIIDYFPECIKKPKYLPPKKNMWDVFAIRNFSNGSQVYFPFIIEKNRTVSEGERIVEV